MWKRLTTIGAFAAAITAAPALAQQTPTDQAAPPAATDQQTPSSDQAAPAADLVGSTVTSSDGKELGKVARVNASSDGNIESIHVEMGSTLGIGGKTVEVSAGQYTETENGIELSLTAEAAEALPEAKAAE